MPKPGKEDGIVQKQLHHVLSRMPDQERENKATDIGTLETQNAISIRNQKQSPLLRLPAELRIKIYEYLFGGYRIWAYHSDLAQGFRLTVKKQTELIGKGRPCGPHFVSALFVCRQIHAEAALLPLQLNDVRIIKLQTFHLFLITLTNNQRNAVRTVKVLVSDIIRQLAEMTEFWRGNCRRASFDAFLPLKDLGGLERLIVESFEDGEAGAKLRLQDLRGLARQYGGHSGVEVILDRVDKA